MFSKMLWYLTFGGILGLWHPAPTLKPEKRGVGEVSFEFPLGTSKKKLLSVLSRMKKYSIDGVGNIPLTGRSLEMLVRAPSQQHVDRNVPVKLIFESASSMYDADCAFFFATDAHCLPEIKNILSKYGCVAIETHISSRIEGYVEETRRAAVTDKVVSIAKEHASRHFPDHQCENCGYGGRLSRSGTCMDCGNFVLEEIFDLDKMYSAALAGKEVKAVTL